MGTETTIRRRLLTWYGQQKRDLPWRKTSQPYEIWVSEIMLQQTRVSAVIPYYQRFLDRFPDVATLAAAPEQDLLAAWSGLGYYSRARNLQKAARQIVAQGGFPSDYEQIRALSGVGDYTAAAIASIAFGLPHVVVDGNVLRVMSRLDNDPGDITTTATKNRFRHRAQALLDSRRPGDFNQALMELGATVCLPKKPLCLLCPVQRHCAAFAAGVQESLPVKGKRTGIQHLERTVLLIERDGRLLLRQRPADSAKLAGFWELPQAAEVPAATNITTTGSFRHSITNHLYEFQVHSATIARAPRGFRWIAHSLLDTLPLSTVARKALACRPHGPSKPPTSSQSEPASGKHKPRTGNQPEPASGKRKPHTGNQSEPASGKRKTRTGSQPEPASGKHKPHTGSQPDPVGGKRKPRTGSQSEPASGTSKPRAGSQSEPGSGKSKPRAGSQPEPASGKRKTHAGNQSDPASGKRKPRTGNQSEPASGKHKPHTGSQPQPVGGKRKTRAGRSSKAGKSQNGAQ